MKKIKIEIWGNKTNENVEPYKISSKKVKFELVEDNYETKDISFEIENDTIITNVCIKSKKHRYTIPTNSSYDEMIFNEGGTFEISKLKINKNDVESYYF